MATYWITFRIEQRTVNGRSYAERYEALQQAVLGSATRYWQEPTSFIAFETSASIDAVSTVCKASIAPSHDLFLVREMDKQNARICGQNGDKDIQDLMPYLKAI